MSKIMDIKQSISAIEKLSQMVYSDKNVSDAIKSAIDEIRHEALIQCEDEDCEALRMAGVPKEQVI